MEHIGRKEGPVRCAESKPETVFIFDMYGAVHEVAIGDRPEGARVPPPPAPRAAQVSTSVIRRWLAGFALAVIGLGILAEPGLAMHRTVSTVLGT